MQTPETTENQPLAKRRPYEKPQLVELGDVRELTRGGPSGNPEGIVPGRRT
jgi:hypothetical protein